MNIFIIIIFIKAALIHSAASDQNSLPLAYKSKIVSETDRKKLIIKSAHACKIPCWLQTCEECCPPLCPFTACNHKYNKIIHRLIDPYYQYDTAKPGIKNCSIQLVSKGYGCFNMYKILCPLIHVSSGKTIKAVLTEQCPFSDILPYIGSSPNILFCMANTCCSLIVKKCDYCFFNYISKPNHQTADQDKPISQTMHNI